MPNLFCRFCGRLFHNPENRRRHVAVCLLIGGSDLQTLYDSGLSTPEIAGKVGITSDQVYSRIVAHRGRGRGGEVKPLYAPPAPCVHCGRVFENSGNRRRHECHCRKVVGVDLQAEYDGGLSLTQLADKYGVSRKFLMGAITDLRSRGEGTQKRREKAPEKYFFGKKNGQPSRGEKVFGRMLEEGGVSRDHLVVSQYHLFGYRLDFAFPDLFLDVEIDGRQHYIWASQKAHDMRRDRKLVDHGWSVYRIASADFLRRPNVVFDQFRSFLANRSSPVRVVYSGQVIAGREEFVQRRERLILKSGVDFSKKGWTIRLGALLGVHNNTARVWVASNMPEFYRDVCRTPRARPPVKTGQRVAWREKL